MHKYFIIFLFFYFPSQSYSKDIKCFWKWGMRTDNVLETMDQSKRGKEFTGEGGYDFFDIKYFYKIENRKKVELIIPNFFRNGNLLGELYTNGNLEILVEDGALKGKTYIKYKCDHSSLDVLKLID